MIESIAPATIAKLLVNARGVKSLPSCPVSAKIGKKDTTTSISAKKIGFATCFDDVMMIFFLCIAVI